MKLSHKPKELNLEVKNIKKIKAGIFILSFESTYFSKNSYPGQFLHIKVAKAILRRPFSIHHVSGDVVYVLFRVRGRGTKTLSEYKAGDKLNIIGPLGRGFCLCNANCTKNILIGGGLGVAPLVFLAAKLKKCKPTVFLGAKDKQDLLCEEDFKKLGCKVKVATEDGSKGMKGTVVDLLKKESFKSASIYTCGPKEMFVQMHKVLKKKPNVNCQVSFEQFMGCGLGVCCACTIQTKYGYKKVCKDGPVFNIKDIW